MLNSVIICGRLTQDPEIKVLENDKEVANITIAVPRSYKNVDGTYETDFINCKLWNLIASNAKYCHKGDMVGIKGRIQNNENGIEIIAEKMTYLSSKGE